MQDNHGINTRMVSDIQTASDPTAALRQDHKKLSNTTASQTVPLPHKTHSDQVMHRNLHTQPLWKRAVAAVRRGRNDDTNQSLQDPNGPPRTGLHQVRYVTTIHCYHNISQTIIIIITFESLIYSKRLKYM